MADRDEVAAIMADIVARWAYVSREGYEVGRTRVAKKLSRQKLTPEDRRASQVGKKHNVSDEGRDRIRQARLGRVPHNKGKPMSPEAKAKLSAALKGRIITPEWRAKISAGLKGKANRVPWNKGRRLTEEHRQAISRGRKGRLAVQ